MQEIKRGDIVSRNSYSHDIIFSVKKVIKLANKKQIAILKGIDVRVEADAPVEDLKIVSKEEQKKREKELEERLCVRPTSETIICTMYAKWLHSYRDLPFKYNQWANVVRWEKTTRPFLRGSEFLWQEGHTVHASEQEAREETMRMLDIYETTARELLAIPMVTGRKTEREKFAGAVETYTIEALMHDGKALQSGTSHYFGDGFAKAFDMKFLDKDNKQKYVHQTSWGVSTRLLGAIIMVHGDDNGLVLPPRVAPTQLMIIPIQQHKEGILDKAYELEATLKAAGIRVKVDASDKSPGWKFSEAEMRGIPLRLEVGPRDLENNMVTIVRRDTLEKVNVSVDEVVDYIEKLLPTIQNDMYNRALERRNTMIYETDSYEEFKEIASTKPGFILSNWCGKTECENKVKDETGLKSRCIKEDVEEGICPFCGEKAKHKLYFGRQY